MGQILPMQRDDRRRQVLPTAAALKEKCAELRWIVEHPNQDGKIMLKTGVTVDRDPKQLMAFHLGGIEVGYRVYPSSLLLVNPFFMREVFFKVPGYKISELYEEEREKYLNTVFDCFFEAQQGGIDIMPVNDDCVKIIQQFQVAFPVRVSQSTIQVPGGLQ